MKCAGLEHTRTIYGECKRTIYPERLVLTVRLCSPSLSEVEGLGVSAMQRIKNL
jgi:hypothetical protein